MTKCSLHLLKNTVVKCFKHGYEVNKTLFLSSKVWKIEEVEANPNIICM